MIEKIVFAFLSVLILVPAFLVVTVRNIFHAALYLVLALTGVAGLFAMLGADFLFAVQILVYSGGITVLMLFVVLLSGSPQDWVLRQVNGYWVGAALAAGLFLGVLSALLRALPAAAPPGAAEPTTAPLGLLLLRDMVLPFEAVSLVLLAALVGAIHFSKRSDA